MVASAFFDGLVASQKKGRAIGICSVCSAHPTVLQAAFAQGLRDGMPVLIESTVNQVNQLGGYTGTTPGGFRAFVHAAADALGFPRARLIIGGDHLGPFPWRSEPAQAAVAKARALVEDCVRAGYQKIHLDASMPLGGDHVDSHGALAPRIVAEREAELAAAAEAAWRGEGGRAEAAPVYVIGTDVPAPGGAAAGGAGPAVTRVEDLELTVSACREAFTRLGLFEAWERVRAVVVQPGVEFFYRGDEPRVVPGSLDDGDVRRALIFVMQDSQIFDSGLRLDSLEALRVRSGDAEVRGAFCRAARNDRNPGVRLKALEALRGFEQDAQVRKTLIEALLRDDNPGVRVEAINALRAAAAGPPDAELVKVLRDRMQNDSNSYIRLQSAAAVRQIGSHGQY